MRASRSSTARAKLASARAGPPRAFSAWMSRACWPPRVTTSRSRPIFTRCRSEAWEGGRSPPPSSLSTVRHHLAREQRHRRLDLLVIQDAALVEVADELVHLVLAP